MLNTLKPSYSEQSEWKVCEMQLFWKYHEPDNVSFRYMRYFQSNINEIQSSSTTKK